MNEALETNTQGAMSPAVTRKHTAPPRPPIQVRRPELRFDSEKAKRWLHGSAATLVAHALSPMFPAGERFFIKAVMSFKDEITDPQLRAEMRDFAAQEAVHTREHQVYDAATQAHYELSSIEELVQQDLRRLWVGLRSIDKPWFRGRRIALAFTVSLEHFTAILGHQVLSRQEWLDGVDPAFATLWSWHAAEEIEHKAVAFDVYEAVGGNWFERSIVMLWATFSIVLGMFRIIWHLLGKDGQRFSLTAWREILSFLFVSPGAFTHAFPAYLSYFRPGFHPWDHDDRDLLVRWKQSYAEAV
jgi:uncharacterized protein